MQTDWVDAIHTRLLVRYGTRWVSMWAGIPEDMVKADWAQELAGFGPSAISYALQHLPPDFPPTAAQFRALCLGRPEYTQPQLPPPTADPGRVRAMLANLKLAQNTDPKAWARDLRDREQRHGGVLRSGQRMTKFQRDAWREALAAEMQAEASEAFD